MEQNRRPGKEATQLQTSDFLIRDQKNALEKKWPLQQIELGKLPLLWR
jgi:hypothetical protein